VYAATSPDGKIYKLDAMGRSTVLFDPPDKYIWGLAVDKGGNVFAATGDKGASTRSRRTAKARSFYQTKTTHAISLAFESDGHLPRRHRVPGRLFRLDANGKPFVLLDSPYNEIHALRLDPKGVIYAAAVSGSNRWRRGDACPRPIGALYAHSHGDRVGVDGDHRDCRHRRTRDRREDRRRSGPAEHRTIRGRRLTASAPTAPGT